MASLDWHCRRTGDVTLVELSVHSEFDQHVRIESRLTPVWPPRQQGVPVAGWNGNTFEGTVDGEQRLVLGYATPATPEEPPAEITATGEPSEETAPTPRDVVRALGAAGPPRDALPDRPKSTPHERHGAGSLGGASDTPEGSPSETLEDNSSETLETKSCRSGTVQKSATSGPVTGQSSVAGQSELTERSQRTDRPVEPTAWFDAVESRLSTVEALVRATDADEARATVDTLGGIEDVRRLQTRLDADRQMLCELQRRSEHLSDRLETAELPLATLERIV